MDIELSDYIESSDYIKLVKKLIKKQKKTEEEKIVLLSSKVNVEQSFTMVHELHSGEKSVCS